MKTKLLLAAVLSTLLCPAWPSNAPAQSNPVHDQQSPLEAMKSKGVDTSLTVLPIRLAGKPLDRVTTVVGVLLEQKGLKNIELTQTVFQPANADNLESLSTAVGAFVRANPVTTDYALYAEYNGTPKTGLTDLRAVVVDKTGAVTWTDRQTAQDQAVKNLGHADPMTLSVLLVDRLSPQFGLNEATAKAAKPGKLAALMNEQSGLPPQSERDATLARQKALKQAAPNFTVLVYPPRVNGRQSGLAGATNLVSVVNQAALGKAVPAEQPIVFKSSLADPNEEKALWSLEREFRDSVRAHPPEADYALCADYAFNPQNADQGFMHFILCDRSGEWVIVDLQNSHWPDYQSVGVTSLARCDQLLVKRLAGYLR